MLLATTKGLGPFKPAIRMNGVLYVLNREFDNEDQAHEYANKLCALADIHALDLIAAENFKPE